MKTTLFFYRNLLILLLILSFYAFLLYRVFTRTPLEPLALTSFFLLVFLGISTFRGILTYIKNIKIKKSSEPTRLEKLIIKINYFLEQDFFLTFLYNRKIFNLFFYKIMLVFGKITKFRLELFVSFLFLSWMLFLFCFIYDTFYLKNLQLSLYNIS